MLELADVGLEGVALVNASLRSGGSISRAVYEECGPVSFANSLVLPEAAGYALEFDRGGIADYGEVRRWIASWLQGVRFDGVDYCLIAEDEFATVADARRVCGLERIVVAGTVGWGLRAPDADEGALHALFSAAMHHEAVTILCNHGLDGVVDGLAAGGREVASTIGHATRAVFRKAYDGEGFIMSAYGDVSFFGE